MGASETAANLGDAERFRVLATQTGKLVYEYDVASGRIAWSGAIEAVTGYAAAEFAAVDIDRWGEMIHPDDRPRALELLERAQREIASYHIEYRFARKGGGYAIVEDLGVFLPGEDGAARLMIGTMGDVTAARTVELERARLAAIVESTSDLVAILDPGGRPTFVNRAGRHLLGLAADAPLPFAHFAELHPRWAADVLALEGVPTAIASGQWSGETAVVDRAGDEIPVSQLVLAHREPDGALAFLSTIARDARERLAAEQLRARLEAELAHAQKMEALGTLAAGLSHDFNNVLTAIGAHVDLIARGRMTADEIAEAATEVRAAIRRASDLVRRLLAFSRGEEPRRVRLDVAPVVGEAVRLARASLSPTIELVAALPSDLPPVAADAGQLHQVVLNLITNAGLAIASGPRRSAGTIDVALRVVELDARQAAAIHGLRPGRHVLLEVDDDGCGMDAATRARVFEPFFTTRPRDQGSGMGLAMVHGVVTAHGGAITVESELGQGSTFRVYLPVAPEPGAVRTAPSARRAILLVDDELPALRAITALLESFGHHVEAHGDPRTALEALRARPAAYDLLITDLAMPHVSGTELLTRARELRADLPAILCTGAYSERAAEVVERLGAVEVMHKPLEVGQLEDAVRRAAVAPPVTR